MKEQYIKTNKNGSKFYYSDKKMTCLHREDGPATEYASGTKEWFINGELHREDGPAIDWFGYKEYWVDGKEYTEEEFNEIMKTFGGKHKNIVKEQHNKINNFGDKFYYSDREMTVLHREDGPAIEYVNGSKEWYINGLLHREDGPAVEWYNGDREYWINGEKHRKDGPAIEWYYGDKEWWINGKPYTEEEFNSIINKKSDDMVKIDIDLRPEGLSDKEYINYLETIITMSNEKDLTIGEFFVDCVEKLIVQYENKEEINRKREIKNQSKYCKYE